MNNNCGVYAIVNGVNNKKYIGSSIDIPSRKSEHMRSLSLGKHNNKLMQEDFNKEGRSVFTFVILELCNPRERLEKEKYWIYLYNTRDITYGYNVSNVVNKYSGIKKEGCKIINKVELELILSSLNIRDKVLVLTSLYFGTKLSESLYLKFKDIDDEEISVYSQKYSGKYKLKIPQDYKKYILQLKEYYNIKGKHITPETYLFLSRKGDNQPISRIQASRIIKDACSELNLSGKICFQSFRKTYLKNIRDKVEY